jgi:hypothetical protein
MKARIVAGRGFGYPELVTMKAVRLATELVRWIDPMVAVGGGLR